jgi:hypothetical protein
MFAEPLPNDLITVPACKPCNCGANDNDEYMQWMALAEGAEHTADGVHAGNTVLRVMDKSARIRTALTRAIRWVRVSEHGRIRRRLKIRYDAEPMTTILKKCIVGMLWHVRKEELKAEIAAERKAGTPNPRSFHAYDVPRLAEGYRTWSYPHGKAPSAETKLNDQRILTCPKHEIGGGAFGYWYCLCEDPNMSIWCFEFYRSLKFMGYTVQKGKHESKIPFIPD